MFDCLYKKKLYSDIKLIINDKEYNLHTKFLTLKSEFFKCLLNNPQMNITDPITITGCNNKKVSNIYINNIIEWFYHYNDNFIDSLCDKLNINSKIEFKQLLEYYYICNYLQIDELIELCNYKINKYFKNIFNVKIKIENLLLDSNGNYYKFKIKEKYINIEYRDNFLFLIKPILKFLIDFKINLKIIKFYKNTYDELFINIMENLIKYDEILFDNFNDNDRRVFMMNMKRFLDDLNTINIDSFYFSIYTKLYNIGFYDLNILLKKDDKICNSCLVRLIDFKELIIDNTIVNDNTRELEKICIEYDIYDEYILKMKYLFENYKDYVNIEKYEDKDKEEDKEEDKEKDNEDDKDDVE